MNQEDRNQNTEQQDTDYKSSYSYDNTYYDYSRQEHTPKPTNGLATVSYTHLTLPTNSRV